VYRRPDIVDTLVIHCSDSPNGQPVSIWDVDEWHRLRGFRRDFYIAKFHQPHLLHFGYHRLYAVRGAAFEGRSLDEVGAHVLGHNTTTIGVCLVGRDRFTLAQWDSLRLETEIFLRRWPGLRVFGHCDLDSRKTCPNFSVAQWLARGMEPHADHIYPSEEDIQ
jgi:hypothetical protein